MKINLSEKQEIILLECFMPLALAGFLIYGLTFDTIKHFLFADMVQEKGVSTVAVISESDWSNSSYYYHGRKNTDSHYALRLNYQVNQREYQTKYLVGSLWDLPSNFEKGDTVTVKYLPYYPRFIVLLNDKGEVVSRPEQETGYVYLGMGVVFLISLGIAIYRIARFRHIRERQELKALQGVRSVHFSFYHHKKPR